MVLFYGICRDNFADNHVSILFGDRNSIFIGEQNSSQHEASNGNKKATRALKIAENFDKTLTTILVGNNIVNILSTSLGTVICTELFGAKGVGIATAAMTVLILIFGEIMPKSLAKENARNSHFRSADF